LAGDVQQPGFHCSQYGLSDRKAGQRLHLVLLLQCGYWDQRPDLFVRPKPGLLQSESQRGQDHRQCDTKAGGGLHRCRILPAQLAAQGNVYGLVFDNRYLERCCKVITVCAGCEINGNYPAYTNQVFDIDVTGIVQNRIDGSWNNYGWLLTFRGFYFPPMVVSYDAYAFFRKKDGGGDGPKLFITYH